MGFLKFRTKGALASTLVLIAGFLTVTIAHAIPGTSYVYPLVGTRISSNFGKRAHPVAKAVRHHNGIDLAAPHGSHIRVIRDGVVVFADPYSGYGNIIVVQHDNGMTSHYGHCQTIIAKPGQKVKAGNIIGTVGSTGISTGPHLHFEIRLNGKPQDPEKYIPGLAEEALG